MSGTRAAARLVVTAAQRADLEAIANSPSLPHRAVRQAKGLLDAADGIANEEIGRRCGVSANTVRAWRAAFATRGVAGVGVVAQGRGRRPWLPEGMVGEVVRVTLTEKPADGSTHWSTRTLAARMGISHGAVAKIWKDNGLQPWRVDPFKLSTDPQFEDKLVDVVGLYLDPPARAVVFCFDEKTQVQALDRTQPSLPMVRGRAGTMTHDYKRHGTTDLFAALNVATGQVIAQCRQRHTGADVLAFLMLIDKTVPRSLDIHVVLDNLSAHTAPEVATWLAHPRRARWHLHFTPTSSSWLNLVERWFKQLTDRRLRRGVFTSVPALIEAITTWVEHGNANPTPFIWHAKAEDIITKVRRGRATLTQVKSKTVH
jgi:transposase/transcriptional regulator with XRE-family HTH domain